MMLLFRIGFLDIHWLDIVDILLVTGLLYHLYQLLRGSVALKVLVGFLSVYLAYLVVRATEMALLTEILGEFMGVGVIAVLILFQNEIRRFLLLLGQSTDIQEFFRWGKQARENPLQLEEILGALRSLSRSKTGALIVVSKKDPLKAYVASGDLLDAMISKQLLKAIFFKNAPLHDGAVIIHKNRIVAARCILPVSQNSEIPVNLGLRHRAAVGISEATDAAAIVVSEETGRISFIHAGGISHNLSHHQIRRAIERYWQGASQESIGEQDEGNQEASSKTS